MKFRFLGPFILSSALLFVFVDYLIFVHSKKSWLGPVWKFLAVVSDFFLQGPALSLWALITQFLFFVAIVLLLLIVVWLSLSRATNAMGSATEQAAIITPQALLATTEGKEAPVAKQSATQLGSHGLGRVGKMVIAFAGITALFGLLTTIIVYYFLSRAIEREVKERSNIVAIDLSMAVARPILKKDILGLSAELARHASREAVAYIFVRDRKGRVLARSAGDLPLQPGGISSNASSQDDGLANVLYRGAEVYETRVEMLDGQIGFLHVGIWKDAVAKEMRRAFLSVASMVLLVLVAGVALFAILVKRINRPFLQLVESAGRISKGNFDISLSVKPHDEVGELACSIEQMRSNLKELMTRLRRAQSAH